MKPRAMREPAIPRLAGENGNAKLNGVDENDPRPPGADAREFHRRPEALRDDAAAGDGED